MSQATADYPERLNLAELVARIERQQAETRKFVAEHDKLAAEREKFAAEREKLAAEALKFERDRGLAPWQTTAVAFTSGAALIASLVALAKSVGWL